MCPTLASRTTGYVFAAVKLPRLNKTRGHICAYSICMILINSNELKNLGVRPKGKYAAKYI